jgi:hypothetical protein
MPSARKPRTLVAPNRDMRQPVVLVAAVALLLRLPPLDAMLDDAQQQPPPGCPSANPATTCSVGFIFNKSTGPSPYGSASYDGFVAAGNCSLDTASSRPCWLMCQEYADAAGNCDAFYLHITTAPPSATNTQVECRIYHGVPTQRIDAATNGVDPRSVVGCTTQGLIGGDGHDPAIIAACCKTAPPPPPADNSSRWHCGADFSCVVAQAGKPGVPKETCMQSCYAPAPPPPENTLLKSLAVSVITGDRQDHSTMRMLIPPFSPTIYDYYLIVPNNSYVAINAVAADSAAVVRTGPTFSCFSPPCRPGGAFSSACCGRLQGCPIVNPSKCLVQAGPGHQCNRSIPVVVTSWDYKKRTEYKIDLMSSSNSSGGDGGPPCPYPGANPAPPPPPPPPPPVPPPPPPPSPALYTCLNASCAVAPPPSPGIRCNPAAKPKEFCPYPAQSPCPPTGVCQGAPAHGATNLSSCKTICGQPVWRCINSTCVVDLAKTGVSKQSCEDICGPPPPPLFHQPLPVARRVSNTSDQSIITPGSIRHRWKHLAPRPVEAGAPNVPMWSTAYDLDYRTNGTGTTSWTNLLWCAETACLLSVLALSPSLSCQLIVSR